tara:strand:+ start:89 stop:631 length:543 start_codon:yes stop_codon:yes gene_type:complete
MKKIKLLILDVDGVLTNGRKYYDNSGKVILKSFCDKDWTAIKLFKVQGIKVIIISGDPFNKFIEKTRDIKTIINRDSNNHKDKADYLDEILKDNQISSEEVCFVGDDIFDIGLMKKIKHSFCPKDSPKIVKENCNVLENSGGDNVIFNLYETLEKKELIEKLDFESLIDELYDEDKKEIF